MKALKWTCRQIFLVSAVAASVAILTPEMGRAMTGPWAEGEKIRARVIVPTTGKTASDRLQIGVQIDIADGWHLPWRQVTAYGPALRFSWFGHRVAGMDDWARPAPKTTGSPDTLGVSYSGRVTVPVTVELTRPRTDVMVNVKVKTVLCNQNGCETEHVTAPLRIPQTANATPNSAVAEAISRARDLVPERTGASVGKLQVASRSGGDVASLRFIPDKTGWDQAHRVHLRHEDVTFGEPHYIEGRDEIAYPVVDGELKPGDRVDVVRLAGNLSQKQTVKLKQDPSFIAQVSRMMSMTAPTILGF